VTLAIVPSPSFIEETLKLLNVVDGNVMISIAALKTIAILGHNATLYLICCLNSTKIVVLSH